MKPIERLISIKHDVDLGELFVVGNRHREIHETYLSLDMAREKRRIFDQNKKSWTKIGIHDEYLWNKKSRSSILQDPATKLYYVQLPLGDDILVSDLYPRKKIKEIQKYLDKHKWSKQSLNTLKRSGFESVQKYYGILPTREGYQIRDYKNTIHGVFKSLNDAVTHRDELLEKGVIL